MAPGRQLGILWGAAAAGLVALSPLGPRIAAGLPDCPFRVLVGIPCVACGSTRAAFALARFDFVGALALNPMAATGWILLIAGGLAAGVFALFGGEIREPRWDLSAGARLAAVAAVLGNWFYVIRFLE